MINVIEEFEKCENKFDDDGIVETTIGDLIQLVNLCIRLDRIEKPTHVDCRKYVMKFLQKRTSEQKENEQ